MDFFLLVIIGLSIVVGFMVLSQKLTLAIPRPSAPITPDSSIITFDIHGVLFTPDWAKIAGLVWTNKKVCSLVIYIFNPRFLFRILNLWHKGAVLEKCITALSGDYPYFARYETFIFLIANTQKPIPHMIDLLVKLKKQGFTLHIFSNIGVRLYEDLVQEFPHEFKLFDKAFTPDGFHGKSHQETFIFYLEQFNPEKKQVVFIDNNKKNITIAKSTGIISIYYKNPQQLHNALKQLNII